MTTGTPWWQTTKTPRYGFILGIFWAVSGLFQMSTFVFGGAHVWTPILGGGELVLAAVYLSSALASRRRQRSGNAATSPVSASLPPSS
jgi:glucose uptake protein GlcU